MAQILRGGAFDFGVGIVFEINIGLRSGRRHRLRAAKSQEDGGASYECSVCLGSCLIMVLSEALYFNVEGRTNADPARLAAQVVSGIGFLGAGAIMKEGLTVTGLTTAACLWVVSGVGLAVGAGYYSGALFTTALIFATLGTLSRLDEWVMHEKNLIITIRTKDKPGQLMHISSCIDDLQLKIRDVKVKADEDSTDTLIIEMEVYNHRALKNVIVLDAVKRIEGVVSVDVN